MIGRAKVDESGGRFYPDAMPDAPVTLAAGYLVPDGNVQLPIVNLRNCPADIPCQHYHFDLWPLRLDGEGKPINP